MGNESNSNMQNIFCHLWSSVEIKNEGYTTKAAKIPTEYHRVFQRQREVSCCSSYKLFLVCNHVTIGGHAGGQGPVVRRPISANPGLNFNPGLFFFLSKAFFGQFSLFFVE